MKTMFWPLEIIFHRASGVFTSTNTTGHSH